MPLYEYQCDACGRRFERIQKYSDPPLESCPTCRGTVKKLLSAPAIQFRGSGFYITDYAKAGSAGAEGTKPATDTAAATGPAKADAAASSTTAETTSTSAKTEAAKPSTGSGGKD